MRRCLSVLALTLSAPSLTGCPLSDDYTIDETLDGGGQPAAGGGTSASTTEGGSGASTQGAGGTAGADGDTATNGGASSTADSDTATNGIGASSTQGDGGSSTVGGDTATNGGGTGGSGTQVTSTSGGETCDPSCNSGRACDEGTCESGWVAMAQPPSGFVARQRAAAVAFEGKVFVFGGVDANGDLLDTGAVYDPHSDKWSMITADAAPGPRELASAVWTGTHVLVVGGLAGDEYLRDAALYDPDTDRWTSIESPSIPRARGVAGVVDGAVVLVQGMTTYGETEIDAERYDLDSESWSLAGSGGDLPGLWSSAIVFGEDDVFVYGGNSDSGRTDATYRYDVAQDTWIELPDGLSNRSGSFGVWDGAKFYVFGGHDTDAYGDGAVLVSDEWNSISDEDAPSPRRAPPSWSGWAFPLGADDFAVMGGVDGSDNVLIDGGRFREGAAWVGIEAWPSEEFHAEGVGVWTGEEFVLWSGEPDDDSNPTLTGERWAP